jgi:hypothetical protein
MTDGSEADSSGILNPLNKKVATGPTPPNQHESRTVDSTQQPGRYEVFSSQSVPVGAKPATDHPRVAGLDVFHEEDANQTNRWLTPEAKGISVIKKGEKQ